MDKAIKKLQSKEKAIVKDTSKLLKQDRKHDKVIDKAEKVLKKKK